jgi:hypothetical protein
MKARKEQAKEQPKEQTVKSGQGKVRGSGVYPASGPWPERQAAIRSEGEWGQRERKPRSEETTAAESDPFKHTQNVQRMMRELMDHLRADVRLMQEPKAQALFETSAEVLGGLLKAFDDYEKKSEEVWQKSQIVRPIGPQPH